MSRYPQSKKSTFQIREVLTDPESNLGNLLKTAAVLKRVQSRLTRLIEPDLATHFQVAAVRKNRLILVTPTAALATRLRMQAPQLIRSLQKSNLAFIEHIDIRVAPLVEQKEQPRKKRPLSPAARQALDYMAELNDDDENK